MLLLVAGGTFVATVAALGCGGDPAGPPAEEACVARLAPSPTPLLLVGRTLRLELEATAGCGARTAAEAAWSSGRPEVATVEEGVVSAHAPGTATIAADAGGDVAETEVTVSSDSGDGLFTIAGLGLVADARTTDFWVHGDVALTGTGLEGACGGTADPCSGKPVRVWDLVDPSRPRLAATVPTSSLHVNDVKISPDGRFAVATHEGGDPGILILALSDPLAPTPVTHFGEGLESGVHNVWIERIGGIDYVFAVANGVGAEGGLHILDVSDLANPRRVAHWFDADGAAGGSVAGRLEGRVAGRLGGRVSSSGGDAGHGDGRPAVFLHDVLVRDGLAFLSHWDVGLVILDVGHGVRGGSPGAPVEVSRIATRGGQTHNAWYWPDRRLVFVGEEDGLTAGEPPDSVGRVHVVDVSDLAAPVEVASFGVPGDSPHNFWVDEEEAVLFVAWYSRGIRAVDVSGELEGRLEDQGRELASVVPAGPGGAASMWAPQLHRGLVYAADQNNGLWVLDYRGPAP